MLIVYKKIWSQLALPRWATHSPSHSSAFSNVKCTIVHSPQMVIVTVKSVQIDQVLRIVPSTMYVLANIIIITMYYFTVNNSKQFLNMR